MIVKIWPVKADYAGDKSKVGGIEGLKNAYDYITDAEKVIVSQHNIHAMNMPGFYTDRNADFEDEDQRRVLNYMADEDKIEGKYISGYMCDPDTAVSEFNASREQTLKLLNRSPQKETGAVAFHLVQSFPEGLNISDEEVHQCGIELCEKINAHQAVICSHVHPVKDEKGEIHGKSKHNHILFNAYINPNKLDPAKPEKAKYHDCKESYAQLRVWNDEIAIAHGLPIIRNPDDNRVYSWMENDAVNKGLSWKQRVRLDIEDARRASCSWEDFVQQMETAGYVIKDGVNVTYIAPGKKHRARGKTLGRQYTKENLQLYWEFRNQAYKSIEEIEKDNLSPPLLDFILDMPEDLTVAVPIGMKGQEPRGNYYLPLEKATQPNDVLLTYFNENELYDICDVNKHSVLAATGREIVACMEQLRLSKQYVLDNRKEPSKEQKDVWQRKDPHSEKERYYVNILFINSRTKRPYRTSLYDRNGRRRTMIELLLLLAITVMKKEEGLWEAEVPPAGQENDPIFAPRSWKIQNMIDSIYAAQEENVDTPAQLDQRLKDAGSAYSRAKAALKNATNVKNKMEALNEAVKEYRNTAAIAERILSMPDGPEKEQTIAEYTYVLSRYRTAKAVLYRYKVTTEEDIVDFEQRYIKVQKDITTQGDKVEQTKEDYRRLKKLSYNVELAQNAQYCYGPNYSNHSLSQKEVEHSSVEIQNGHEVQKNGNMQKRSNNSLNENENERKEEKKKLIKQ